MARRGRIPSLYMQVLRLLKPCQGYPNGMKINEIAKGIYGRDSFQNRAKARQLIGAARKAMREQGIIVDLFSIKPVGMDERRYCYLMSEAEYTKAIDDFEAHIEGTAATKERLEQRRKTVEERIRLEEARKKVEAERAKKRSQ